MQPQHNDTNVVLCSSNLINTSVNMMNELHNCHKDKVEICLNTNLLTKETPFQIVSIKIN